MLKRLSHTLAVTALAAATLVVGSGTAHADILAPTTGVVVGTGTITPGLPCNNCAVRLNFTAVTAGGITGELTGCVFTATTGGVASELSGAGLAELSGCNLTGFVSFNRIGLVEVWNGDVLLYGICHTVLSGVFAWVPTSVFPIATYALTGSLTLDPC